MPMFRIITVVAAVLLFGPRAPVGAQTPPASAASLSPAAAQFAAIAADRYATLAPLDVNHDGALDATEAEAVDAQVATGTLLPPMLASNGARPPHWAVRLRAARVYAWLAVHDLDRNGVLDDIERQAIPLPWSARGAGPPWRRRGGR